MDVEPPALRPTGSLAGRVATVCDRFKPLLPPGPASDALASIHAGLGEPLRVAVTGRVNAGKSTLVNALLGQRVAPTGVSECTRYVTWYRHGVPERLEVVLRDGSRQRHGLRADGSMPTELGAASDTVRHLEVYLGNNALRSMTVIDTPGLASSSGRSGDTGELLALDVTSRLAVAQADAVLFALTAQSVASDASALDAFRAMTSGTSSTALNAIGVLSRADQFDAEDPLAEARLAAAAITERAEGTIGAVVSVVGLLAETATCGLLTEAAVGALQQLAALDDSVLDRLLLSTDRFSRAEVGVPPAVLEQLLERLDLFGIARAITLLRSGAATATHLLDQLRELSGHDDLLTLLGRTFTANADALKATAALTALERLAYSGMGAGPLRQDLLDALEEVQLDPSMHRLAELRAWLAYVRREVELSPELARAVTAMTLNDSPPARLGLPEDASGDEVERAAHAGIVRWKSLANDAGAPNSTRVVAEVMVRSHEHLWTAIREAQR
jgi:hypothetical protein